jgi:hypothetical protein
VRDSSNSIYKALEDIQQRIAELEQEAQLLPPGRILEPALREIRRLRSLAVAKRWAPDSGSDLSESRPSSGILFLILPTDQTPLCPKCQRPKTLELQLGGKVPRTFQCLDCERPDPLTSGALDGIVGSLKPPEA